MKDYFNTLIRFWIILAAFVIVSVAAPVRLRAQTQDKVVGTVNGKKITERDVDDSIALQIMPLKQQLHQLQKAALENLITRAVLEDAAAKKGITVDELKKQLTAGKVEVSSNQIEHLYAENVATFGGMSPDEAKERLRLDLESQARMKLYRDALAQLRKVSRIELHLEEPRLPSIITDSAGAPSIGPKNAAVTIIEFSDFQCPYCRESQTTLKQILQNHAADVRLIFKHLPLDIHSEAFGSAKAAFCAGEQGRFWQFKDALFSSPSLSPEARRKAAVDLGLNMTGFESCLESEASRSAIQRDLDDARRLGISSTPTFVINGKVFRGTPSLKDFQALIQTEVKTAQTSVTNKLESPN